MKLWIDDIRIPPDGWMWAKTSEEAIECMSDGFTHIAFDHDLGGDDTSRRVVMYMIENSIFPANVRILTANPVGREWLLGTIRRYWPHVNITY